jgi:hypothetical protein
MTPLGALVFVAVFALLVLLWAWDKPSVPSVYARLRPSPSRRGAGLPPGSAPAGEDERRA